MPSSNEIIQKANKYLNHFIVINGGKYKFHRLITSIESSERTVDELPTTFLPLEYKGELVSEDGTLLVLPLKEIIAYFEAAEKSGE